MTTPPEISLRAARVNAGFPQKAAAKALNINPSTLRNWENGITVPNWNEVQEISKLYNYPAEFIFFGKRLLKVSEE